MDDSSLLELAGKAAAEVYGPDKNPLQRDDLALRLAVKLEIEIYHGDDDGAMTVWAGYEIPHPGDNRIMYACEQHKGDPYAATRRAIVRAAAAIGEQMP